MYTRKSRVKVVYLQQLKKTFMNSKLMNTACRVQELLEREDEILSTGAEMYKSCKVYRHNRTHLTDSGELRYEVYLRFIDKFCRDQGTMMLLFACAKAVSACSVSLSIILLRLSVALQMLCRISVSFIHATDMVLS